jgi:hypothetical protein
MEQNEEMWNQFRQSKDFRMHIFDRSYHSNDYDLFAACLTNDCFKADVIYFFDERMKQFKSDCLKASIIFHCCQKTDVVAEILKIGNFSFQILICLFFNNFNFLQELK